MGLWIPSLWSGPGDSPRAFLRRTRDAGGGGFAPTDIAGLLFWYKADGTLWQDSARTTPVTSDTDPVGAWDDESGNSRHATVGNSFRPAHRTNIQNSLPALQFTTASSQYLLIPSLGTLTAGDFSIVAKKTTGADATSPFHIGSGDNTHMSWSGDNNIYNDFMTSSRPTCGTPVDSITDFFLYNVHSGTNDWACRINAQDQFSRGTNTVVSPSNRNLGSGSNATAPVNYFLDGYVGEVLMYDSVLSTTNRDLVEAYLNARWAIY